MRDNTKSGILSIFVSFINEQELMNYQLNARLNGNVVMTSRFHENKWLQRDKTLYKFLWMQNDSLAVEVDHIPIRLAKDEIIILTPSYHLEVKEAEDEYLTLVFSSNFYYIFGHDDEVPCNGVLLYGSSQVMRLEFSEEQSPGLYDITRGFCRESAISDSSREEMLRTMLRRFIITCTRTACTKFSVGRGHEKAFDTTRQFYVLVDGNFREKKQMQDYAGILCRSPKTLPNLPSACGLSSPLRIIHEQIKTEAERLLLYTRKGAKEIGDIPGFEDSTTFSRSFKEMTGECVSEHRKRVQREELSIVMEQLPFHVPSETGIFVKA